MALPTILINSAAGSDTAASGAGPNNALTGSAGVTSADGLTVVLDGSPDLTNVETDGSHVLFMSDTNVGSRNFGKITGKANSGTPTAQVTVAAAFQPLNTDAWAIGGERASIGSTTSRKLVDNNSAVGDAQAGWTISFGSGHTETLSATLNIRVSGDTTSGLFYFVGPLAGTTPILTFSNNGDGIILRNTREFLGRLELRNSHATKTASRGIVALTTYQTIDGVKINHSTDLFLNGIDYRSNAVCVKNCDIGYCAGNGIESSAGTTFVRIRFLNNFIHNCTGIGASLRGDMVSLVFYGNIVYANGGDGAIVTNVAGDSGRHFLIAHNTFDANTGDGLEVANDLVTPADVLNNIFSNNGGYGLKFSSGSATADYISGSGWIVDCNDTYNNTSGGYLPASYGTNDPGTNPTYKNASGGDFSIGTNLKAKGYPIGGSLYVGRTSATYSYVDPGAAQRQEFSARARSMLGF